jgi:L-alanine-DL-glutamate epimerase-like enolase superfamily enzyme
MIIDVRDETITLPSPVATPVGTVRSVFSVVTTVRDTPLESTGRVRCRSAEEAREIIGAARAIAHSSGLTEQHLDEGTWAWWNATWTEAVGRSHPGAEMLALSSIDAALWGIAAPPGPVRGPSDSRIYWSGFWLGDSLDSVRREAVWSIAQGFDGLKMRCDASDLRSSVERFETILQEIPQDMDVAIELAGTGTVEYVRLLVGDLDTDRVLWVEDPVPVTDPEGTASLVEQLPVPIAGGEHCWGTEALEAYVRATGLAMPILDMGYCGGPSALASFAASTPGNRAAMGVHLDATCAAQTVAHLETPYPVWIEVMDWWEQTTPSELRALVHE